MCRLLFGGHLFRAAQAHFAAADQMFFAAIIAQQQRTRHIHARRITRLHHNAVAQQGNRLVLVAVGGFILRFHRRKTFPFEHGQCVVQFAQHRAENIVRSRFAVAGSLHADTPRHRAGIDEIDTDADDAVRLPVLPHGFNQNTAQLVQAHHQIVRPFDAHFATRTRQTTPARQRHHQSQRRQFMLRLVPAPAHAEHQALAQLRLPRAPLPSAPRRLFQRGHHLFVDGKACAHPLQQFVAGRSGLRQHGQFKRRHAPTVFHPSQRLCQLPHAVALAQSSLHIFRRMLPQMIQLLRHTAERLRQIGNMVRPAVCQQENELSGKHRHIQNQNRAIVPETPHFRHAPPYNPKL